MLISDVKKLNVQQRFLYWIKERHSIYLKRLGSAKAPWTDDVILQSYRFCNVRRMNDKVSKWLLESWYLPNYNSSSMFYNVVLARLINKPETLDYVGFQKQWYSPYALARLISWREAGNTVFNGAYIVSTNGLTGDKLEILFKHLIEPLVFDPPKLDTTSVERSVQVLTKYWGLSTFLGGQIVADLVFAMKGTWADKGTWAAIGPGSRRGMNRALCRKLDSGMGQAEFNGHLTKAIQLVNDKLPHIAKGLHAIDVQNCLCEFDKYERCLWGEGKPKQKYKGV